MLYFHTRDSLTLVKDGCIDRILLFKKEKSGIGLCAEICTPAVWELRECSFLFVFLLDMQVLFLVTTSVLQSVGLCISARWVGRCAESGLLLKHNSLLHNE